MEQRNNNRGRRSLLMPFPKCSSSSFLLSSSSCLPVVLLLLLTCLHGCSGYQNYTVGDSLGWFDNLLVPKVNYQKWAAGKNFSLGDFLIFNTDKNHSVVQTYNASTYKHCDYNDAQDDDTTEWSAGEPAVDNTAITVPVPLLKEGLTYFFSGNYDGEQCHHGQHFKITVAHGLGLPESLRTPSQESPAPLSPDVGSTVPDTVVPSNFDNPTDTAGAVKASSGAGEGLAGLLRKEIGVRNLGLLVVPWWWGFWLWFSLV